VIVFADSSAIVKLYVNEPGHEVIRAQSSVVVGQVARMEIPAAFWRKHRIGELGVSDAQVLTGEFEADYFGTPDDPPRFIVVAVTAAIVDDAAVLCARYPLRAYDALQLASALRARSADPGLGTMAVFDATLASAAAAEGLAVLPDVGAVSPIGQPGGR